MTYVDKNKEIFKPGDIVIFKSNSSHLDNNHKFTRGKEYTIQESDPDDLSIYFYKLLNDKNYPEVIFSSSIEISPRYLRNKTIENILL